MTPQQLAEFQCRCKACAGSHKVRPDLALEKEVDAIHARFGNVVISSGFRCETHNLAVGGSSGSLHQHLLACDLHVPGIPHTDIYAWVSSRHAHDFGVGIYTSHVHVDSRSYRARWDRR